jgi:hypothetical protein
MNLYSIHKLNGFLANAVPKNGSVLDVLRPTRRQCGFFYLLQVDNPSLLDPARVWASGMARLVIGDRVTFYYQPANPQDARVIDGKENSRYETDFLFLTLILTFFVFFALVGIEKEIHEKEGGYTKY